MKDSAYTLVYAAVLGAVCAALLTGASELTASYRKANEEAERKRNILEVLEVPFEPKASSRELLRAFEKNVRAEEQGGLSIYVYAEPSDRVRAIAVPFSGSGVWGPIKGFLSLDADLRSIRGLTFYQQEETPGLGGEIESERFRKQFRGRSVQDAAGKIGIRILRAGGASAPNEVDGISGATMTCGRVEVMLNEVIGRIVEERKTNER